MSDVQFILWMRRSLGEMSDASVASEADPRRFYSRWHEEVGVSPLRSRSLRRTNTSCRSVKVSEDPRLHPLPVRQVRRSERGGGHSWSFMGECLRKACPCLEALWQRISSDKKASPGGGGGDSSSGVARSPSPSPSPSPVQTSLTPAHPKQVPPPPQGPESGSIYTALWGFESRHKDELSFQEGDLFRVISRKGDWWTARRIDTNGCVLDTGIVPQNYLTRAESLQIQP